MSDTAVRPAPRVAVVGGGVAGLTAAVEVAEALPGARVTVLEKGPTVGGALRREEVAGHLVDVGAESLLAVRPEAVDLVGRLGAAQDLTSPATTSAAVWSRGRLHPMPRATLLGVPATPASARGVLEEPEVARLADERPWPGGPLTEDVAVGDYVATRLGAAVVDRLVEPLLGGVYAGHAHRLSLRATMPAVWQRGVAGDSLLRGEVPGPPAPPERPPFAGVVGGVGRLPGLALAHLGTLGVEVRIGSTVRALERTAHGWRLVVGSAADPTALEVDAVVLAVPPAPTSRLLAPHAAHAASLLADVETASMAVVTLAVTRAGLPGLPGSGFLVPPVDGRGIKAATFSAAKWGWVDALDDAVVHLRASVGRAGEEASLQRTDEDLVALAVAEVGAALAAPLPRVVDAHVQRWGGALPQYAVGHVDRVEAVRADVAALPGLAVAGAAYDGVGVPAVVGSATRAAEAVVHHLTARSVPSRGEHP
ncbi:FAD-dependent oxidoreductase [Phycicoccus sp. BSK3Z-2]|uniref:FAD-dependent oxidoreductase n=1 Tax=Phycicoccus avicenniae TaxID=2828860 RepID=A0A941D7B3_9MICO|nr:FAD-dependent oxidoreductase [Phycicoccus avicenniae]MBR7742443.1 FAD-dependent oxidoreductase [Phycicoccus avicenniae]